MPDKNTPSPVSMDEIEAAPLTHQEEMMREINDIRESLAADDTHLNRLPEHFFTNLILPFVAGDPNPPQKISMDILINMAGGPYKELIITDQYDNELFRVPPVFDPEGYNPVLNKGDMAPIKHVIITAQQLHMASPRDSQNYLASNLAQRRERMGTKPNRLEFAKRWNELAARYGRPPIFNIEGALPTTETPDPTPQQNEKIPLDDWDLA